MKMLLPLAVIGAVIAGPALAAGTGSSAYPSNRPMTQSMRGQHLAADQTTVREVQQALKDKGYQVGSVDGIAGRNTRQAVRQFQKDQGLPTTGQLDQQTLAALNVQGSPTQTGQVPSERGLLPGEPTLSPAERGVGGAGSVGQPEQAPGLGGPAGGETGVGRATPGGGMRPEMPGSVPGTR